MPLYVNEACNLFVGDTGPDNSKHLNLNEVKLPTLEEVGQTYYPGGAVGEIEIGGLGLKALEVTFKIKGVDPQVMGQFGLSSPGRLNYTIYGAIRDKKGNTPVELKAILQARMNKFEGTAMKRGELGDQDYRLHEIVHYELWFNGAEKYYYDFLTSDWRVNGVSQNADVNNILRITGA